MGPRETWGLFEEKSAVTLGLSQYRAPLKGSLTGVPLKGSLTGVPLKGSLTGVPLKGSLTGVPLKGSIRDLPCLSQYFVETLGFFGV